MIMPYALMINIEFLFRVQCDNGKLYAINLRYYHNLVRKYGKEFHLLLVCL